MTVTIVGCALVGVPVLGAIAFARFVTRKTDRELDTAIETSDTPKHGIFDATTNKVVW